MSCRELETRLDEFLDGYLQGADRRQVEEHLSRCAACSATVEAQKRLREAVGALPTDVRPARDLFPEIRDAVERTRARSAPPVRAARAAKWLAAVAASLLVVAALWAIRLVPQGRSADAGGEEVLLAVHSTGRAVQSELQVAEEQYIEAATLLLEAIDTQRGELPPETAAVLDENLAVINEAIDRVRTALEQSPGDPHKGHVLAALHQQKVNLLWRVSRLAPQVYER